MAHVGFNITYGLDVADVSAEDVEHEERIEMECKRGSCCISAW